jgi:hypothetical protein
VQLVDRCAFWKFTNGAKNLVLQKLGICSKFPCGVSVSYSDLISALWRVSLMLAIKRSLLNWEQILINVHVEHYTDEFYIIY